MSHNRHLAEAVRAWAVAQDAQAETIGDTLRKIRDEIRASKPSPKAGPAKGGRTTARRRRKSTY